MSIAFLQDYVPSALAARATFPPNGVGPFVVTHSDLIALVVEKANPDSSVHISGCRGAGKTTLLRQVGQHLMALNHAVYYFKSTGSILTTPELSKALDKLMKSKDSAYVLLDETQDAHQTNETLISLLKNEDGHCVTVIGAGISSLNSVSNRFDYTFSTDRLFLSEEDLQAKHCFDYFCTGAHVDKHAHIKELVMHIREYAGGHIYPVMRLSELLVPLITEQVGTGKAIVALHSEQFRQSDGFCRLANRIMPPPPTDIRPLLYINKNPMVMESLMKKGFCDMEGKIVSHLLFDLFTESMVIAATGPRFGGKLLPGVEGVRQVLGFALPKLSWDHYESHGGAVEDALTFELILILTRVAQLKTRLFNPKLIDAGKSGRRPDLFLNSSVDAYVECVRTQGRTATDIKSLEEHINRFVGNPTRYDIGERDFAILHYQVEGTVPLVPRDQRLSGEVFMKHVYTFTMVNKAVFRGLELITA
eukprot:CAMPEP_0119016120 /NCGR_PEP_ID=MMETSP1176-20130426/11823_1 /TAXON_ID=265551 /ORGANISM="Synedropsis recta cf, Strain CCMP1620" /LENGTH=475 /DNA_ID=CAMNT_0006969449 /DNA_START=12 /DNA_END=1439 /DNA_ORIENTATION=+